jgi:hypothetical protein
MPASLSDFNCNACHRAWECGVFCIFLKNFNLYLNKKKLRGKKTSASVNVMMQHYITHTYLGVYTSAKKLRTTRRVLKIRLKTM